MGFFSDAEDEKKKRGVTGEKTGTAASFFTDVGKNIVAGTQQGLGVLADVALEGGAVIGSIGKSDEDVAKSLETTEFLRGLLHDLKDVNGENIGGTQKADKAADKINKGEADLQDYAQLAGTSLDAGLAATQFINPVSAARATAARTGETLVGKEVAKDVAKVGATFGGTSGGASALDTYAETGDVGEAVKSGVVGGVTGAIVPTALDVAGRGTGAALREVLNKKSVADQVSTKAEMTNGTKAAQQATDELGTPVTRSQVINAAEPEVSNQPLSMEDLSASAERPIGQTPAEYLAAKNAPEANKTMAAEVTPGRTDSLQTEIKLDDASAAKLAKEIKDQGLNPKEQMAAIRASGMTDEQALTHFGTNTDGSIVKKPAQVEDMPRKVSALDEPNLDANQLRDIDPSLQPLVAQQDALNQKTSQAGFLDRYTKGFINRSTEETGALGADVASSMVKGAKVKADIGNTLRPIMQDIDKGVKKVAGKTEIGQAQFMTKVDKALTDRANARSMFKDEAEFKVYQNIEKVYDYIKEERQARGLAVREDYSPTQMIRAGGEDPSYLAQSLNSKITTADSRFSKARRSEEGADQAVFSTKDLYNYVNSQSTEFAYKEAAEVFREGIKNVPPEIANSKQFQNGIKNLADAYAKAVTPKGTTKGDAIVKGFQSTIYKNILWNNPKNAMFSRAQTLIAKGDVSKQAKQIVKSFDKDTLKEIYDQKWFGDATISADMPTTPESRLGKVAEGLRKADINRVGEEYAVKKPFALGYAQGLSETAVFKDAVKGGASPAEAAKIAMGDEAARAYAERAGNVLVNNTSFGANSMARPEFLRDASAVKRAFTMFMRFPIGMTQLVKDSMNPAQARAVDVLMKGDPRAVPIPEMRAKYQSTLKALNQIEKAAKDGKLDVNQQALSNSIKDMKANIKVVDDTIKDLSTIRGNKRAVALTKMWAATAAIQFAWTGLTDPEDASVIDAAASADPTIVSKVNPANPYSVPNAGLTSPLLPSSKYGINLNGATNLIPGVGAANRITKYATGKSAVDWLRGKE